MIGAICMIAIIGGFLKLCSSHSESKIIASATEKFNNRTPEQKKKDYEESLDNAFLRSGQNIH